MVLVSLIFTLKFFETLCYEKKKNLYYFLFSKSPFFLVNPSLFTFRITTISNIREASPSSANDNITLWLPPLKLPNNLCHMTAPTFGCLCSLKHGGIQRDILQRWCLFRKEVSNEEMNQEYSPGVWVRLCMDSLIGGSQKATVLFNTCR